MLDADDAAPLTARDFDGDRLPLRTAAELEARLKRVESLPVRPQTQEQELHRRKAEAMRLRRRLQELTNPAGPARVRGIYATQSADFMAGRIARRSMPELVHYLEGLRRRMAVAGAMDKWEVEAARVAQEIRRRGVSPGTAAQAVRKAARSLDRKRKRDTREAVKMARGKRRRKSRTGRTRRRGGGRAAARSL